MVREPRTPQSRATGLADVLSEQLINVGSVQLDSMQRSLCELLARNYHETWSLEQMKQGVVHGDGRSIVKVMKASARQDKRGARQERHGTTRVEIQTSALLRPFELLPPEDQRGNRSQAEELVKAVVAMGYRIVARAQLSQEMEEAEHAEIRQLEFEEEAEVDAGEQEHGEFAGIAASPTGPSSTGQPTGKDAYQSDSKQGQDKAPASSRAPAIDVLEQIKRATEKLSNFAAEASRTEQAVLIAVRR